MGKTGEFTRYFNGARMQVGEQDGLILIELESPDGDAISRVLHWDQALDLGTALLLGVAAARASMLHLHPSPRPALYALPAGAKRALGERGGIVSGTNVGSQWVSDLEAERDRLRAALQTFKQIQGETIPVYNDEFVRVSWVHELVDEALGAESSTLASEGE